MTRTLEGQALPERARTASRRPHALMARVRRVVGLAGAPSLAVRFLLASLTVLVLGGVTIGWWVGDQIQRGIISRTSSITALYVQSFIEPHIAPLATNEWLSDESKAELDALFTETSFSEKIVALKVWRPDGVILYSPDRTLIGQQFAVEGDLATALAGDVSAEMSTLSSPENAGERGRFRHLLEMYIPVRERGGDRIIAVAEFYQIPTEIYAEVRAAQQSSWFVVAGSVSVAFVLLFGIVRQGSETIVRQRHALESQVDELSTLLGQNEQLRGRVRTAAERTTTLSERNLRRISSDLHDGPGQMLALAMLRLEQLRARPTAEAEFNDLQSALSDALRDMRAIAAGLRLPELDGLPTADAVRRVIDDHSRRSGSQVEVRLAEPIPDVPLPTKIALFRALQELLSNSTRHGGGKEVSVSVGVVNDWLRAEVSDRGPGFDSHVVGGEEGHLGLAGIREQAELLGGAFEVQRREGGGATVIVSWPL